MDSLYLTEVKLSLLLRVKTAQLSKAMSTKGTVLGELEHLMEICDWVIADCVVRARYISPLQWITQLLNQAPLVMCKCYFSILYEPKTNNQQPRTNNQSLQITQIHALHIHIHELGDRLLKIQ